MVSEHPVAYMQAVEVCNRFYDRGQKDSVVVRLTRSTLLSTQEFIDEDVYRVEDYSEAIKKRHSIVYIPGRNND